MLTVPDSDEGLVVGQTEVTTPAPTKEARPAQDADSSPEVRGTPHLASSFSPACVVWLPLSAQEYMGYPVQLMATLVSFNPEMGRQETLMCVVGAQCCLLQSRDVVTCHCNHLSRCWAGPERLFLNIVAL